MRESRIICIHKLKMYLCDKIHYPTRSYLFKVNKGNTRAMREICSKLKVKNTARGVVCKKVFLEVSKIHRKRPVPESLFNKVASLRPATLLKKRLWHRCFPVNFVKFLTTPFLQNTSGRLLLQNSVNDVPLGL